MRSPLKTAASGTSFADFESCNNTTPATIVRKDMIMVIIWTGVPLKPRKRMADVMIVADVKQT